MLRAARGQASLNKMNTRKLALSSGSRAHRVCASSKGADILGSSKDALYLNPCRKGLSMPQATWPSATAYAHFK